MQIGEPKRELIVDPLELPEPLRETPSELPERIEEDQPTEEPVKHGTRR